MAAVRPGEAKPRSSLSASYPFLGPAPVEEWAQVTVTRVTVNDRQQPPAPAPYGTQLAPAGQAGANDPHPRVDDRRLR